MLLSDHQNSVKSSPKSRKWHFRDSKLKNFLWSLALEAPLVVRQIEGKTLTNRGAILFYDRDVLLNLLNTFPDVGRSNFSCGACPTSFSVIIDPFLQNAILFMFFAGRNEPSVFLSSGCLDTSSMINKTPESFPQ